jgi:cbb3-type cytochrome oxidase subunit 3
VNLSEIISHLDSGVLPAVSLLLFVAVFVAVTYRTMRPSARAEMKRAGSLPLEDGHE